jgi:MoxR-like ATPase
MTAVVFDYRKHFDPGGGPAKPGTASEQPRLGDRDNEYFYGDDPHGAEIVLAVNVALAVKRPLLLRGAPGCGKSSLARDLARRLGRTYYEKTITSRMTARDLQWTFDAVRRLGDAHVKQADAQTLVNEPARYVQPGPLWWAFDPVRARKRGSKADDSVVAPLPDPGVAYGPASSNGAVLLLDEIDKAEPDVPNDLLVPLGAGRFDVDDLPDLTVETTRPLLVVITTNEERELAPAFVRRCVPLTLTRPTEERSIEIARTHFPDPEITKDDLRAVARRFAEIASLAEQRGLRPPGTAEFLDAVRSCIDLRVRPTSRSWRAVTDRAFWKHAESLEGDAVEATS